ncbi:transcriptional regulator [Agromyces badenianii]|uniref:Transcriptional regulator n=1 Tax=Agromyces badenianii TaxID=2080742 RepID=A0A2S0WVN0_9MICO|nr:helix-turn-helix transcriptional regulator [Agromyces badenianii]AWB95361.1 transcriptional regulator [Agromyces badenianii]
MSRPPGEARGLGKSIQASRLERGWSQTELAMRAGVSRPTISRVELGEEASTRTLHRLVEVLNLVLDVRKNDSPP